MKAISNFKGEYKMEMKKSNSVIALPNGHVISVNKTKKPNNCNAILWIAAVGFFIFGVIINTKVSFNLSDYAKH